MILNLRFFTFSKAEHLPNVYPPPGQKYESLPEGQNCDPADSIKTLGECFSAAESLLGSKIQLNPNPKPFQNPPNCFTGNTRKIIGPIDDEQEWHSVYFNHFPTDKEETWRPICRKSTTTTTSTGFNLLRLLFG